MNQVSMNALNNGWSLGFGTSVPAQNSDFDQLVAHKLATGQVPAVQPSRLVTLAKAAAAFADDLSAAFVRRAAH